MLLRATGITKYFGPQAALDAVDFEVLPGEVHALAGANGAGKSTLVKIIYGALEPDAGSIEHAPGLAISYIPQELQLVPHLSVAENIFLGNLPRLRRWPLVNWRGLESRARELAAGLGLEAGIGQPTGLLSAAEQQMVAIAHALARMETGGAQHAVPLLILDEPTAALSPTETDRLFEILGRLRQGGAGLIYISHRLEETNRLADRITVLRDGRHVYTGRRADVSDSEIVAYMTGKEAGILPEPEGTGKKARPTGEEVLAVRHLSLPGRVKDVSFSVRAGEVLGLAGVVGSGRTSLLRALFGAEPQAEGEIFLAGRKVSIRSPAEAIRHGLALLTEDRKAQGLVLTADVATNISLASGNQFVRYGLFDHARERAMARGFVERLSIRAPSVTIPVSQLSGGNQQKVLLARWLSTRARVFLLDEPTRGIDVEAKQHVYALVRELAAQGAALVLVSSELEEVLALADRILVLDRGEARGELPHGADAHAVLLLAVGGQQ